MRLKNPGAEASAEQARVLLRHYFNQVDQTKTLVKGDCATEIGQIADNIIDAAIREAIDVFADATAQAARKTMQFSRDGGL